MELILNELKQYGAILIPDTRKNNDSYNLSKDKKYITVYNKLNQEMIEKNIICIIYSGKFKYYQKCHPGAYGQLGEGYYFESLTDADANTSIRIVTEYDYPHDLNFNFYEIDENFDENRMKEIYDYVVKYDNSICFYNKEYTTNIFLREYQSEFILDDEYLETILN